MERLYLIKAINAQYNSFIKKLFSNYPGNKQKKSNTRIVIFMYSDLCHFNKYICLHKFVFHWNSEGYRGLLQDCLLGTIL